MYTRNKRALYTVAIIAHRRIIVFADEKYTARKTRFSYARPRNGRYIV